MTSPRAGPRRRLLAGLLCLALSGCASPYAGLLMALIPDGTFTTLLKNMQGVSTPNQEKLAALEKKGDGPESWRSPRRISRAIRTTRTGG